MKPGDMVYYLHTDKQGVAIKFAAIVLSIEEDDVMVRVGRYDVHSKKVSTFESMVSGKSLQMRSIPCSYEDELIRSAD